MGRVGSFTQLAFATGAERGFLYVRGEYPLAERRMVSAINTARDAGLLALCGAGSRVL